MVRKEIKGIIKLFHQWFNFSLELDPRESDGAFLIWTFSKKSSFRPSARLSSKKFGKDLLMKKILHDTGIAPWRQTRSENEKCNMHLPAVAYFKAQKRDACVSQRDTCSVAQHLDKWGTAMRQNGLRYDTRKWRSLSATPVYQFSCLQKRKTECFNPGSICEKTVFLKSFFKLFERRFRISVIILKFSKMYHVFKRK